jgi:hypothetical protein
MLCMALMGLRASECCVGAHNMYAKCCVHLHALCAGKFNPGCMWARGQQVLQVGNGSIYEQAFEYAGHSRPNPARGSGTKQVILKRFDDVLAMPKDAKGRA